MAKKKKDRLSFIGLISSVLKGVARQRSFAKARASGTAVPDQNTPKVKKPKDTRTPDQIRGDVDRTRRRLVNTVDQIKYDLDVPARAKDLRDRLAARVPREWRGEPRATIVAASVFTTGIGAIVLATFASVRRGR